MTEANKARGESTVKIDGKDYRVCLGVWGLAQIDTRLNLSDMSELVTHFNRPSSIFSIFVILLQEGGDWPGVTEDDMKRKDITFLDMKEAIIICLEDSGLISMPTDEVVDEITEGN